MPVTIIEIVIKGLKQGCGSGLIQYRSGSTKSLNPDPQPWLEALRTRLRIRVIFMHLRLQVNFGFRYTGTDLEADTGTGTVFKIAQDHS
jgi:hypothetical protein